MKQQSTLCQANQHGAFQMRSKTWWYYLQKEEFVPEDLKRQDSKIHGKLNQKISAEDVDSMDITNRRVGIHQVCSEI